MPNIAEIEGVGASYAEKLARAGVTTTEQLLREGATRDGRADIAEKSGLSEKQVLDWVNKVDLSRIGGVGSEYADLLEAAGVDTVPELAQRNATSLLEKLEVANAKGSLVRRLPTKADVEKWISQAKVLPRAVHY